MGVLINNFINKEYVTCTTLTYHITHLYVPLTYSYYCCPILEVLSFFLQLGNV